MTYHQIDVEPQLYHLAQFYPEKARLNSDNFVYYKTIVDKALFDLSSVDANGEPVCLPCKCIGYLVSISGNPQEIVFMTDDSLKNYLYYYCYTEQNKTIGRHDCSLTLCVSGNKLVLKGIGGSKYAKSRVREYKTLSLSS